jgi:hypothetical protein
MSGWLAIASVVGTIGGTSAIIGGAVSAIFAERSKRAEWEHQRHVQFDTQLLEASVRLSHETTSIHDRLKFKPPLASMTRQIVAQSLDWSAYTEAATRVRLLCPASLVELQQVQLALFALVTVCEAEPPRPEAQVMNESIALLGALGKFEEAIRKRLDIPGADGR